MALLQLLIKNGATYMYNVLILFVGCYVCILQLIQRGVEYVFDIVENAFSRAAQKKRRDPGKLTSSSAVNHQAALFFFVQNCPLHRHGVENTRFIIGTIYMRCVRNMFAFNGPHYLLDGTSEQELKCKQPPAAAHSISQFLLHTSYFAA